jgi:hypothetical protein
MCPLIEDSEDAVPPDSTRELLAKLLKRREELRIESEALDNLIRTYSSLSHLKIAEPEAPQLDLWKARNSSKARSAYVAEMLEEARRIIIAEGRPMTRSELLRRLEQAGFIIEGRDKSKVLGTNIWRSKKFETVEGQGYWPIDIARPY